MLLLVCLSALLLLPFSFAVRPRNSYSTSVVHKTSRLYSRDVGTNACADVFNSNADLYPALSVFECLTSVPFNQTVATQFLKYYKDTLEFQSTLTYLKSPPSSYQQRGVDILGGLDRIQREVDTGNFHNQYDFEIAVQDLIYSAHDGHLYLFGGASDIFSFGSPFYISSVSDDGIALPKVYITGDLIESLTKGSGWTASPIATINGQNTTDYLTRFAALNSQGYIDPNADWNNLMYSPAGEIQGFVNAFAGSSPFYPGDVFDLVFENGTGSGGWDWLAVFNDPSNHVPLTGPSDFYSYFVVNDYAAPTNQKVKAKRAAAESSATKSSASATPTPTSWKNPAYPQNPIISENDLGDRGVLTGYILENSSIGVLSVPTFNIYESDVNSFSATVGKFLRMTTAAGVKKIVIDLQQNDGGFRLLATDVFKQFFPSIDPYSGRRQRAHSTADLLGSTFTEYYNSYVGTLNQSFSDYFSSNVWVAPLFLDAETGQNFKTWAEYYGPHEDRLDYFTAIQRDNLSSIPFDLDNDYEVVYGYANRTANVSQPYAADDIIILTDSLCSSTCSLFVEMMHYEAGVRTVVVGGRPQKGPMQARAGTRGARAYDAGYIDSDIYNAESLNDSSTANLPDRNLDFRLDRAHFNLQDEVRQGENFPLQFAYEAADCRIFYTKKTFFDFAALWQYAADAIWTNPALCVKDSTNHPSAGHVTDKVGPSTVQKAAWAAPGSENAPSTPNTRLSIDPSMLFTVNGPNDDAAGHQGKICDPTSFKVGDYCGAGSYCVRAPYCGSGRSFYQNDYRCRPSCGNCILTGTNCQKGFDCELGPRRCSFCATKSDISRNNCRTLTSSASANVVPNFRKNNPPALGKDALGSNTEGIGTGNSGGVAKAIMSGIGG